MSPRRASYYRRSLDWALEQGVEPGLARRMARRHTRPGEPTLASLRGEANWEAGVISLDAEGNVEARTIAVDHREAQRAVRHGRLVEDLRAGRIGPAEFRRKARRIGPIGGVRPVSDPGAALAGAQVTPPGWSWYRLRRPLGAAA